MAARCTSAYSGQVKDPTHGVNVSHVVDSCSLITSLINPHEQQALALEGCTFHTYLPTYWPTGTMPLHQVDPGDSSTIGQMAPDIEDLDSSPIWFSIQMSFCMTL